MDAYVANSLYYITDSDEWSCVNNIFFISGIMSAYTPVCVCILEWYMVGHSGFSHI